GAGEEKRPRRCSAGANLARGFRPLFRGQTTGVRDALCRFQNANDAPPADAQNVTGTRKSCEVPSFPSFPHVPKERPAIYPHSFFGGARIGRAITAVPRSFVRGRKS